MEGERKKLLLHARLQTAILLCILVVLVVALLFMAVRLSALSAAIERLSQELDIKTLNTTVTALRDAADQLGDVDVQTFNDLIAALDSSAQKLQGAVNAVTGLFTR